MMLSSAPVSQLYSDNLSDNLRNTEEENTF